MLDWEAMPTWSVLLVDDEPDYAEVIAEALGLHGLSVKIAENSVEALAVLKDFSPTVILLDLSLPKMDSWETRKRVKANPRTQHIPIVAVLGNAVASDKDRVLAAGFDGYLAKPINVATLLTDLRVALQDKLARCGEPFVPPTSATKSNGKDAHDDPLLFVRNL